MGHSKTYLATLAEFDQLVTRLYTKEKLSTYSIASFLRCTQGRVGRSLRRSNTPRRTHQQAQILALRWAA